uniref:Uncharacterized protein n=1 Tax=Salix viminalis TaxID=40686 RepID=A0A6N2LR18_SALVM
MSTNSLYHVKQASPFPGIPMIEYAEHEQFLLHSISQSARLLLMSTQVALEVSGRRRFLTQPPDPSLADHCSGYLGSNPERRERTCLWAEKREWLGLSTMGWALASMGRAPMPLSHSPIAAAHSARLTRA